MQAVKLNKDKILNDELSIAQETQDEKIVLNSH